jgi:hypothetical protein
MVKSKGFKALNQMIECDIAFVSTTSLPLQNSKVGKANYNKSLC